MHRLSKDQTKLLEQLICKVTEFPSDHELVRQCMASTTSTLRLHQYLSISPPDIEKNFGKLIEKLDIHSQCHKSEYLRQVIDEFLNSSLEEPTAGDSNLFSNVDDSTRSESHFQLLAFLWFLQHTPQSSQLDFKPLIRKNNEEIDTTDWHKLLLEDIDEFVRDDYLGESSSSDEEDDSDEDTRVTINSSRSLYPKGTSSSLATTDIPVARTPGDLSLDAGSHSGKHVTQATDMEEVDKWLRSRIHCEYSNSAGYEISSVGGSKSSHKAMQFKRDWDAYVFDQRLNRNHESKPRILLKEEQIIREVLWMLSGADESFLFQLEKNHSMISKNRFVVKGNVTAADVANDSLDNLLSSTAQYGSICAAIRSMSFYVNQNLDAANTPEEKLPRTIGAFVAQLQVILMKFQEFVHSLEEEVRQWATHTLLEVFASLRPWFRRLSELYTVVAHVTAGRFETLHWESTAVMVIDALFDLLCSHWATHVDDEQLRYLSEIFVNTLEPYLASMDTLLAGSQVSSKTSARSELFMAKRGDVARKDAIVYWRDAFTLKYFAGRGMILSSVPKILHPFVHRLIVTVKSMDFLIVISEEKAMPELVKEIAVAPGAFVAGFGVRTSWLRSNNEADKSSVLDINASDTSVSSSQDLRLGQFDLHEFVDNPLLRRAIAGALPDVVAPRSEAKPPSSVQFSVTPLRLLLHNSLRRLIFERHLNVSRHLLTVLLDRLHLRRVLQHICDVFLLRRGDLLDELTRYLFARMQWPGAPWREQLPLNLLLHQCLTGVAVCVGTKQTEGVLTQEEAHRFWLTVDAVPAASIPVQVALSAFDSITLHYQPAWPFEVVLTPETITLYSSVFRFLLQLRRVKSSLEGLQFWTLERRHVEQVDKREERPLLDADCQLLVSRLHVLRIKVLHIVNSLHQFLMHRIIHSAVIDFQRDIDKVEDLVDFCSLHQHFVRRVFRCCLLGEKAEVFRKSFMKLLHLGVTIERVWLQGMDVITDQLLGKMEKQFSDYTLFLHGVFKTAVKNVDFEYLEPLAMAFKDRGESASSRFSA